ncbi:synembryn-B isoform X2 [Ornithorhynchus anatinus]|uniref:synembryn-B isoform X2 n=1 Tax=Ornithorhynchus anatinus TaxID=9258 RepID=UPI0010A80411|nr:synembryn-B isoform X2 [Ornithorhynchus anatinus]
MAAEGALGAVRAGRPQDIEDVLREYSQQHRATFKFEPSDEEKRKKLCEGILSILERDITTSCQVTCLEALRILSRDKKVLVPVTTKENMKILMRLAKLDDTEGSLEESDSHQFRVMTAILRHCLLTMGPTEDKTEELHSNAVNLLSNVPVSCLDVLISPSTQEETTQEETTEEETDLKYNTMTYNGMNMDAIQVLLNFMEKRIDKGSCYREGLTPVLSLLTECSRAHRNIRKFIKDQVLPPLRDVTNRPEVGSTVRNKLVRLMTHVDLGVKQIAAEFLFVLCKERVDSLLKYTGYGNAAGLLAARGLLAGGRGDHWYSDDEDTDTEEYKSAKPNINLITGHLEEPMPNPLDEMTEEQKEYEAMKLVNMLDKLSREEVIKPMGVRPDGTMTPLEEALCHYQITEENSSDTD